MLGYVNSLKIFSLVFLNTFKKLCSPFLFSVDASLSHFVALHYMLRRSSCSCAWCASWLTLLRIQFAVNCDFQFSRRYFWFPFQMKFKLQGSVLWCFYLWMQTQKHQNRKEVTSLRILSWTSIKNNRIWCLTYKQAWISSWFTLVDILVTKWYLLSIVSFRNFSDCFDFNCIWNLGLNNAGVEILHVIRGMAWFY